jgi:hypothetical protein
LTRPAACPYFVPDGRLVGAPSESRALSLCPVQAQDFEAIGPNETLSLAAIVQKLLASGKNTYAKSTVSKNVNTLVGKGYLTNLQRKPGSMPKCIALKVSNSMPCVCCRLSLTWLRQLIEQRRNERHERRELQPVSKRARECVFAS